MANGNFPPTKTMKERPKETFQNDQEGIPIEIPNVGCVQSEEFGIYRNQISTKAREFLILCLRLLNHDKKFENRLGCKINERGYIMGLNNRHLLPIRNLAYFANKENKFAKELGEGRRRGDWIKTIYQNIGITTSQTTIVADFISKTIKDQALNSNDIIMLKYLKKINKQKNSRKYKHKIIDENIFTNFIVE